MDFFHIIKLRIIEESLVWKPTGNACFYQKIFWEELSLNSWVFLELASAGRLHDEAEVGWGLSLFDNSDGPFVYLWLKIIFISDKPLHLVAQLLKKIFLSNSLLSSPEAFQHKSSFMNSQHEHWLAAINEIMIKPPTETLIWSSWLHVSSNPCLAPTGALEVTMSVRRLLPNCA